MKGATMRGYERERTTKDIHLCDWKDVEVCIEWVHLVGCAGGWKRKC